METFTFEYVNDDGLEQEGSLPARYEVCPRCQGKGKHCDPNIDGNGITEEEWSQWDEDEKETYLRGGYDVICEECRGQRVVLEIDMVHIEIHGTFEEKELLERYLEIQESLAECDQISQMERLMGA